MNIRSQRGASYVGIMAGALLAVLVIKAVLIIWPAYWDNKMINESIKEKLMADSSADPGKFMAELDGQLSRNNIRDLNPKDIMKVSTDNSNLIVDTDYEVRQKFMGNIDLIMSFKQRFDQRVIKSGGK